MKWLPAAPWAHLPSLSDSAVSNAKGWFPFFSIGQYSLKCRGLISLFQLWTVQPQMLPEALALVEKFPTILATHLRILLMLWPHVPPVAGPPDKILATVLTRVSLLVNARSLVQLPAILVSKTLPATGAHICLGAGVCIYVILQIPLVYECFGAVRTVQPLAAVMDEGVSLQASEGIVDFATDFAHMAIMGGVLLMLLNSLLRWETIQLTQWTSESNLQSNISTQVLQLLNDIGYELSHETHRFHILQTSKTKIQFLPLPLVLDIFHALAACGTANTS